MATVFLNGKFVADKQAAISPFDRGFLFADAVYEVIPVYGKRCFREIEHIQRLNNSLTAVGITSPYTTSEWQKIFEQLIASNHADDQCIYLQISRGSTGSRDHDLPSNIAPTVFATTNALKPVPNDVVENGVSAILLGDIRWQWCHIKSTSLLANILLKQQATEAGANEAILHRSNMLTEGASSNIFVVKGTDVYTPPTTGELLPGITRQLILDIADNESINIQESSISVDELKQADEIWISSSTRELYPITSLDNQAVGNGKPGKIWQHMFSAIQQYKHTFRQQ